LFKLFDFSSVSSWARLRIGHLPLRIWCIIVENFNKSKVRNACGIKAEKAIPQAFFEPMLDNLLAQLWLYSID
jgi:hypothetical protein